MISLEKARAVLDNGSPHVALDSIGEIRPVPPGQSGPATALVSKVADALKSVGESGMVEGSIDRDSAWVVQLLVFSNDAIDGLPDVFGSFEELYLAVEANGFEWKVSPTPSDP